MTLSNDQWQEAIVQLANAGISGNAAASATGAAVPASADYIAYNSGGNLVGVSATNPLPVAAQHASAVDATNSSTTLLTANSIFTGTWQSSLNYSAISVQAFADQASAASGLQVQQSQDGVNADTSDNFSVSASTNFQQTVNLTGKFYRIKYTNGGTGQGTFRLQTVAQTSEVVLPRTLTAAGNLRVDGSSVTQPVSGTFWQATQPVSIASMPSTPVTGTFWQATQPVSAASLPLPSNAAQETGGNLATLAGAITSTKMQANVAQWGGQSAPMANADAQTAANVGMLANGLYNGSTVDRWQGKSGAGYIARLATAAYSLASTTTSGSTQNSGDITVGPYTEISLDINTTAQAGTNPTLQLFYERKGADGIYYVLWQSNVLTAATNTISTSIGAGMAYNQSLGSTGRLRWVVGGTSTPTFTFSANITGK